MRKAVFILIFSVVFSSCSSWEAWRNSHIALLSVNTVLLGTTTYKIIAGNRWEVVEEARDLYLMKQNKALAKDVWKIFREDKPITPPLDERSARRRWEELVGKK